MPSAEANEQVNNQDSNLLLQYIKYHWLYILIL